MTKITGNVGCGGWGGEEWPWDLVLNATLSAPGIIQHWRWAAVGTALMFYCLSQDHDFAAWKRKVNTSRIKPGFVCLPAKRRLLGLKPAHLIQTSGPKYYWELLDQPWEYESTFSENQLNTIWNLGSMTSLIIFYHNTVMMRIFWEMTGTTAVIQYSLQGRINVNVLPTYWKQNISVIRHPKHGW